MHSWLDPTTDNGPLTTDTPSTLGAASSPPAEGACERSRHTWGCTTWQTSADARRDKPDDQRITLSDRGAGRRRRLLPNDAFRAEAGFPAPARRRFESALPVVHVSRSSAQIRHPPFVHCPQPEQPTGFLIQRRLHAASGPPSRSPTSSRIRDACPILSARS